MSDTEIIRTFVRLTRHFDQDGVLIKLPGSTEMKEYKTGVNNSPMDKIDYGKPAMGRNPLYYTKLRKGHDPEHRNLHYDPDFTGSRDYGQEVWPGTR